MSREEFFQSIWYQGNPLGVFFVPLSMLYRLILWLRNKAYEAGLKQITKLDIPVIVIGNITVGGTGKSPLTIWLVEHLRRKGKRPGVVSRGYGGQLNHSVQQVRTDSNPLLVGDEPVMIVRRTHAPVAIGKNRAAAAQGLIDHNPIDVIICDDGLQHKALARDIEIAVIDGYRRFGNGRCLPAGPLREPMERLEDVDLIVANGRSQRGEFKMEYEYGDLISLADGQPLDIQQWKNKTVHAVCGIGNPDRFFQYLLKQEVRLIKHRFPDHHVYKLNDIQFEDDYPIVMTEKDAVKCETFKLDNIWYLRINATLPDTFVHRLDKHLEEFGIG